MKQDYEYDDSHVNCVAGDDWARQIKFTLPAFPPVAPAEGAQQPKECNCSVYFIRFITM